ncbi:DnaJ-domain-containing protein [Paxillus ammoniavirescens]|nr:DnaJ-domain-containing protein [Paxillus ammoniavirescens]
MVMPPPCPWTPIAFSSCSRTIRSPLPRHKGRLALSHGPAATQTSHRQFSCTVRREKHNDHYAALAVPRNATKAQIKTSYYQLSKKYHPDVAKDKASRAKFHALCEAYAVLGNERKRREYDRTFSSSSHSLGLHPQATTTRPSQQPGFRNFWPNHPRNRPHDPTGGHAHAPRHNHPYEHARAGKYMFYRPPPGAQTSHTWSHKDPFSSPFVQRATGQASAHHPSGTGSGSGSGSSSGPSPGFASGPRSNSAPQSGNGDAKRGGMPREASSEVGRQSSETTGRPTQEEVAAESGALRALGASGLVGVIMLIAAVIGGKT